MSIAFPIWSLSQRGNPHLLSLSGLLVLRE